MKFIPLISLLLLAVGFSAKASDVEAYDPVFNGYPYLGIGVSNSALGGDFESESGLVFDEDEIALSLIWGSRFSENLAFELAYHDFGKHEGNVFGTETNYGDVSVQSYSGGINYILPYDKFDFFVSLGAHLWRLRLVQDITGQASRDDGWDFYYGIGGTYHINQSMSAGLRYTRYLLNETFTNASTQASSNARIGNVMASFNIHF